MPDVAIPIAFPDYTIAVPTGTRVGNVGVPYLGHAGVLIINGNSGLSYYREYGRYMQFGHLGGVKLRRISDVKIDKDGHATQASLAKTMNEISSQAGKSGAIEAAYISMPAGKFKVMRYYLQKRLLLNKDSNRKPYDIWSNSCMHFAKWTVEASGLKLPGGFIPSPLDWMEDVQDQFPDCNYAIGKVEIRCIAGEETHVPSWAEKKGLGESVWAGDTLGDRSGLTAKSKSGK